MELAARDQFEAALARGLGRLLRQQYRRALELLGTEPRAEKLTAEFWRQSADELQGVFQPLFEKVYLAHVEMLTHEPPARVKQGGIGIEWALVNERAAEWARRYSTELARNMNNTTQSAFFKQIENFYRDQRTLTDLEEAIGRLYGPMRAELVAVTEVTRAAAEGERMFAEELRGLGLNTSFVWQTANDDRVCPICGPRHEKRQGDGWDELPPAHGRCRCWVNTVVVSD